MQTIPTTPFGRRPLSLAMVAREAAIREFATQPRGPEDVVHKWRLFRALTEAKAPLGVTDRALSVLHALLSFHQETTLSLEGDAGIVVFPSNRELSIRAHGMAPATLRRHLACLVEAGLILRRDSPNGKRFARRGPGGAIADAFGFDLAPLVARAAEIENLAEEVRAENRAIALLRERITVSRRDIAKMIEAAMEAGLLASGNEATSRLAALAGSYSRKLSRPDLAALAEAFADLATELRKILEDHVKLENMRASESQIERHIQNQTTNILDLDPRLQKGQAAPFETHDEEPASPSLARDETGTVRRPTGETPRAFPLGMVLSACPDIGDFAPGGISSWPEFIAAASVARRAIGVSPDAWRDAQEILGEQNAAIVVAVILQRGAEIRSAGGYLRVLTAKARAGDFSLGRPLMALWRGRVATAGPLRRAVS